MNDPHNLMSYARNIFPKSLQVNNYQQKKVCLSDALFWTMSEFLYKGNSDLKDLSHEVSGILVRKNLFEKTVVSDWVNNHFLPSAATLLTREYQKQKLRGKIWTIKDYLGHRQSGASMHNEATLFLLLLEPSLILNDFAWDSLIQYLVLYTDYHSWKKDKLAQDYYNIFFSIQYEMDISEAETERFLGAMISSREKILKGEFSRQTKDKQIFLEGFLSGAGSWCETTPRYKI